MRVLGIRQRFLSGLTVFCVGFALIAQEIVLMRFFAETWHHHVSFLVIGIALLGMGASGTALSRFHFSFAQTPELWIAGALSLFSLSTAAGLPLADSLSVDFLYLVYDFRQVLYLILYIMIIFLSFFFGSFVLGGILEFVVQDSSYHYGVNLLAGGIGGLLPLFFLSYVPSYVLIRGISLLGILGGLSWIVYGSRACRGVLERIGIVTLLVVMVFFFYPWKPTPAPYKASYRFMQLENEGLAKKIEEQRSPRGTYTLFESPSFHYTLFAGLSSPTSPPPQIALLKDGEVIGTIFKIQTPEEAKILDYTPQSVPYRMLDKPRVLILDETGGTNLWLAKRFGASSVTVVISDPTLTRVLQEQFERYGGSELLDETVELVTEDPRMFLKQSILENRKFDLIQIASAEEVPASSSGLLSPRENFLLTVEGIEEALSVLTEEGILSVTRGLQTPPRDCYRMLGIGRDALKKRGTQDPQEHVLLARNYLAFLLMFGIAPISFGRKQRFQEVLQELGMDPEYVPGIKIEEILPYKNEVPGPEGTPYSYYYWGAKTILEGNPEDLYRNWIYDVSPSTDNKPYFYNFFSWRGTREILKQAGTAGFRRAELGYLVVLLTGGCVLLGAVPLLLIAWFGKGSRILPVEGKKFALVYFMGIGFAFMFLELTWIASFRKIIGDPHITTSIVLTGLLLSAGIGSLREGREGTRPETEILRSTIRIILFLILFEAGNRFLAPSIAQLSPVFRYGTAFALICIPGYSMGTFFPAGLRLIRRYGPALVPLAWASNGFASVAATPLAQILTMSFGFPLLSILAGILYLYITVYTVFHVIVIGVLVEKRSP